MFKEGDKVIYVRPGSPHTGRIYTITQKKYLNEYYGVKEVETYFSVKNLVLYIPPQEFTGDIEFTVEV